MHMDREGSIGVVFKAIAECQAILDDNPPRRPSCRTPSTRSQSAMTVTGVMLPRS